ncbi:MAG: YDG domain-containing protein, partial [Acidimicrobiaceae bacterium]|nr:YDG domain-containing protein [Acidimicrobiaceae bacterium]
DLGFTVEGLIDGDAAGDVVSGDSLARTTGNNAGSYTLSLGSLAVKAAFTGKYKLPAAPSATTYTITKKPVTVADAVLTRVYDGTTAFGSASLSGGAGSGTVSGESLTLAVTGGTFASKNAGTGIVIQNPVFSFTEGASTDRDNYELPTTVTLSGTITKKQVTVADAVVTRPYDGTTAFAGASLSGGAVSGTVSGESLTLVVSGGTFASDAAATGIAVSSPQFSFSEGQDTDSGNYQLPTSITLTGTITKRQITAVGAVTVTGRDWDGTTAATFDTSSATGAGVLAAELDSFRGGGLVVSGSFPSAAVTTAGHHSIAVTYTLADAGSGTGAFKAANYEIATAAASATLTGTLTAVVPGVPQSVAVSVPAAAESLNVTWSAPTSGGGAAVSGYRVRWRTAQVGTQGDQDYAAAGEWQDADGTDDTGEDVGAVTSYTIADLVAGTVYDVAVAATNSAGTGGFSGEVQGTPAALIVLTITPAQTSRVYGGTEDLGFTVGGLRDGDAAGDVVSGDSLARTEGDNAGTYTLSLGSLAVKAPFAGKYKLPAAPSATTYTITKKPVTYSSTSADKVYDGTTAAPASLGGSFSPALIGDDEVTVTGGTYASKNVGTAVAVSGATAGGADIGNYTVTVGSVTGDITKRPVTVAAAVLTRPYDGTTAFGAASLSGGAVSGEVSGESLTLVVSGGTFASDDAATNITVSSPQFSFTEGPDTDSGNYQLPTSITVTGTITKRQITAVGAVTVTSRDWDGTTTATFDTSAATGAGVLTAELESFRGGGLRVSGSFPAAAATTAGDHSIA